MIWFKVSTVIFYYEYGIISSSHHLYSIQSWQQGNLRTDSGSRHLSLQRRSGVPWPERTVRRPRRGVPTFPWHPVGWRPDRCRPRSVGRWPSSWTKWGRCARRHCGSSCEGQALTLDSVYEMDWLKDVLPNLVKIPIMYHLIQKLM